MLGMLQLFRNDADPLFDIMFISPYDAKSQQVHFRKRSKEVLIGWHHINSPNLQALNHFL